MAKDEPKIESDESEREEEDRWDDEDEERDKSDRENEEHEDVYSDDMSAIRSDLTATCS